ncbi:hypothetical protein BJX99DRAFT_100859 [Aspergillus californicus]
MSTAISEPQQVMMGPPSDFTLFSSSNSDWSGLRSDTSKLSSGWKADPAPTPRPRRSTVRDPMSGMRRRTERYSGSLFPALAPAEPEPNYISVDGSDCRPPPMDGLPPLVPPREAKPANTPVGRAECGSSTVDGDVLLDLSEASPSDALVDIQCQQPTMDDLANPTESEVEVNPLKGPKHKWRNMRNSHPRIQTLQTLINSAEALTEGQAFRALLTQFVQRMVSLGISEDQWAHHLWHKLTPQLQLLVEPWMFNNKRNDFVGFADLCYQLEITPDCDIDPHWMQWMEGMRSSLGMTIDPVIGGSSGPSCRLHLTG